MPNNPHDLPPAHENDPRERDLSRRSGTPTVSMGIVIGAVLILAGAAYVISALT